MKDSARIVGWVRRLSEIALVGWLLILLLTDTAQAVSRGAGQIPVPVLGVLGIMIYLLRDRYRVAGFCVLLAASAVVSAVHGVFGGMGLPGFAEAGTILLLTVGALRWVRPLRSAVLLALIAMAVLEVSVWVRGGNQGMAIAYGFLFFVAWATAAGIGGYLRYLQERREQTVNAVRRAERLELARELHDLVAHHITGIVVQAQAARTVAEHRPEAVVPSLDAIAGAGGEALTSMRRLVGVLRAEDDASRVPGGALRDLRVLVERFAADGPAVTFDIAQGVDDATLPPGVITTLHRVLQESLTNIRRHAPGAGWVQADLRPAGRGVRLLVRNPRSGADPHVSRLGGGFGLVGMAERVTALGGELTAGPAADGAWRVVAWFPLEAA
ncbi:sensor histidine kinase [Sphaerisporangium rufum]|uniref:sensor histidine kinase n=1 Tax=Sphaerisporangium rufum TaxID=1381558 RepID=UPI0019514721|nr:histidine kinase [Sphaerisporangium rufum]